MAITKSFARYLQSQIDFAHSGAIISVGVGNEAEEILGENKRNTDFNQLIRTKRLLDMSLYSSVVDSFQSYLADVLYEIFEVNSKMFSSKQVPAKWLFEEPDLESLKKRLIDRQIIDIGYKGIDDLDDYLRSNLGINLTSSSYAKIKLSRIIQARNIATHNRGIVNKVYIFKTGSRRSPLGSPVKFYSPIFANRWLANIASNLDRQILTKLSVAPARAEEINNG